MMRISTLLARPIRRWEFLVGHWLGVTLFSIASLLLGLVLTGGLSWYFGIEIDRAIENVSEEHELLLDGAVGKRIIHRRPKAIM